MGRMNLSLIAYSGTHSEGRGCTAEESTWDHCAIVGICLKTRRVGASAKRTAVLMSWLERERKAV